MSEKELSVKTAVTIDLEKLRPGAVLAHDIADASGRRLLAAATALTPELIELLARRHIRAVPIVQTISAEAAAARRKEIDARLARRFRNVRNDPVMQKLETALRNHRLESLK